MFDVKVMWTCSAVGGFSSLKVAITNLNLFGQSLNVQLPEQRKEYGDCFPEKADLTHRFFILKQQYGFTVVKTFKTSSCQNLPRLIFGQLLKSISVVVLLIIDA